MKEIYADFNDFAANGALPLTCAGSLSSLAQVDTLEDGEEVWLTDGELKVKARVYQRADGSWEGRSEWSFQR